MKKYSGLFIMLFFSSFIFAGDPGGNDGVPIDDYTNILIGVALLLIGLIVFYKNKNSKIA